MVLTDEERRIANDIAIDMINECEERSREDPKILATKCMADFATGAKIFARGLSDPKLDEIANRIDLDIGRHLRPKF